MAYTARVEEIAALLRTLEGAGIVHPRLRLASNWGKALQFFRDPETGLFDGWMVTRRNLRTESPRTIETYALTKVRALNDAEASDLDFQDHLDAAVALFRNRADLSFGAADPLQIETIEPRLFGDVLCHVADCELAVSLYYSNL